MPFDPMIHGGLFLAAFLAATLLPLQSEAALVALLLAGYPPWLLVLVASLGNISGSILNWGLGRFIERYHERPWFPLKGLERTQVWYRRYGRWSLLLSWMPIIGDPLTVAAGVMREKFMVFVAIVSLAKTGRYMVLALTAMQLIQ